MAEKHDTQEEDAQLVTDITKVVREADEAFQTSGGGSRHWVREQFLPRLNAANLRVQRPTEANHAPRLAEALRKIRCKPDKPCYPSVGGHTHECSVATEALAAYDAPTPPTDDGFT